MLTRLGVPATCVGLLTLLLAGCGEREAVAQGGGAERPVPVVTGLVATSDWSDTLQALGTVKARESVTLSSKVSEVIARVHFESGDEVRAGAPLITLRGDAQQAALIEAQATAAEAEQLFDRQNELASQQLIARSQLDTQRAVRDSARARVAQMRSDIGDRSVRAPFSGVLGLRQVSPGALITPSTAIATLDDISRVYVDFQVPEAMLAAVREGGKVDATTAAYPGQAFEGEVSAIDARIDPGTRAVNVRADFDNPDRLLRPGMLMAVNMIQPEREALMVPEIAVVQEGRVSFVYRVNQDSRVEQAMIEAGVRRDGQVEILDGLVAGDRIVIDGTGKMRPGMLVVDAKPGPVQRGGADQPLDSDIPATSPPARAEP